MEVRMERFGINAKADEDRHGLGNSGTGSIIITSGTLKLFDNDESYNNTYWNITVPAGGNATLLADSRCAPSVSIDWVNIP